MVKVLLIFSLFSLSIITARAQSEHDHKHPDLELGVSGGCVYNFTEKESAPGVHIHVIKFVNKTNNLAFGFGYETIFDDHKHHSASFIMLYRPINHLSFNFAPGLSWLSTEKDSLKPSMHIEALYEWELGNFHVGPLVGVAFNTKDFHGSVGLHLAIGF